MPEPDLIVLYSIGKDTITLAPPEYVILRKLEYYREGGSEKHLRDIRAMLAISGDLLDRPALQDWIQRLKVETQWRQVLAGSEEAPGASRP
jgi:hypothetical protein